MPNDVRWDRLLAIISILKKWKYREPLTKQRILDRLDADHMIFVGGKTIQRDIEILQTDYEAPIEYTAQKGYRLTDPNWDFKREIDMVSPRNLHALMMATELTAQFKGTPLHGGLKTLTETLKTRCDRSALSKNLTSKVQFLSPPAAAIDPAVWDAIMTGLLERRWMEIQYCRYESAGTEMTIAPCRLVSLENEWYLFSEKKGAKEIRQLAVRNIRDPKVLKKRFTAEHEPEINKMLDHRFGWFACDRDIQQVTVVFDKAMNYLIDTRVWHTKQTKRILENGDLEIRFPTSADGPEQFRFFEVRKWILGYAGYVKKIEPELLRSLVLADIERAQRNLSNK
jgi:predicted DNA-binding transcriptional regulator YafY